MDFQGFEHFGELGDKLKSGQAAVCFLACLCIYKIFDAYLQRSVHRITECCVSKDTFLLNKFLQFLSFGSQSTLSLRGLNFEVKALCGLL